ncbi:MAG TPA: hypothetical protein VGF86_06375 [Candidatus Tumulicola sp.]|jgi:hypothetical protein
MQAQRFLCLLGISAAILTAGCSMGTPGLAPTGQAPSVAPTSLFGRSLLRAAKAGLYVGEFYGTSVYGFRRSGKGAAVCTISGVSSVNDLASDAKGDIIEPDGGGRELRVFRPNCGAALGVVPDPYGQPADATSVNAASDTIAIANIFGPQRTNGSISLCSLKGGCTTNLTNPNMYEVTGVAMSKGGDCWASAEDANSHANLTYFKGCKGSGETAKGFINPAFGGLDFDAAGNLVSFSGASAQLYVYSGCNPRCKLAGGPFSMAGTSAYGHLNKTHDMLAVADYQHGQIDLYTYTPTIVNYVGSFNSGLSQTLDVVGVTYAPH